VVFFGAPKKEAELPKIPAQAVTVEEENGVVFFGAPKKAPAQEPAKASPKAPAPAGHKHEPVTVIAAEPPTILAPPERMAVGQVTVENPRLDIVLPKPQPDAQDGKTPLKPKSVSPKKSEAPRTRSERVTDVTARVALEKLDSLMNLVGELIIAEAAVTHNTDLQGLHLESFQKSAMHLNRITRSLQDVAMSMRMVPVRHTFRKQLRVVRDVARELGKNVELKLEGEETEVDKSVVEALNDPLVHIIRNAVDHGMEDPEERAATNKEETGVVTLTAIHQSGEVWITVQDDGRGLDREKILAKARERGVVGNEGAQMSDRDVFNLLFAPGFSTAAKVTKISGRGVGLDVARRNIEQLGGRVDIDSVLGEGTTFTLRIPLTLAIIEGMLVRVGFSKYTVPLLNVRETVRVSSEALVTLPSGQEVVHIRDQIFSLVRLHEIHHIQPDSRNIEEGLILVLESSGERYCLFVDDVLGQFQTVIKSLGEYFQDIRGISGCTILGTGEVSLILDTDEMRRLACIERTGSAPSGSMRPSPYPAPA
jgi:two-component system chemotaxis sensor kinase CheA